MHGFSAPDRDADYFKEKQSIQQNTSTLQQVEHNLGQLIQQFNVKNQEVQTSEQMLQRSSEDVVAFKEEVDNLEQLSVDMQSLSASFTQQTIQVDNVKREMDDGKIPLCVQRRRVELEGFSKEFENAQVELNDMIDAYNQFQGNPDDQAEIAQIINEINPEMEQLQGEEAQAYQYL